MLTISKVIILSFDIPYSSQQDSTVVCDIASLTLRQSASIRDTHLLLSCLEDLHVHRKRRSRLRLWSHPCLPVFACACKSINSINSNPYNDPDDNGETLLLSSITRSSGDLVPFSIFESIALVTGLSVALASRLLSVDVACPGVFGCGI